MGKREGRDHMHGNHGKIDYLLRAWGRWSVRVDLGGLGYSRSCASFRLTPPTRDWQATHPQDIEVHDLDAVGRAVDCLAVELRIVCVLTYREEKSLRAIGKITASDYSVVRNRLRRVKESIARMLEGQRPL